MSAGTTVDDVRSLPEVNASIAIPRNASFWKRLLAIGGPGFLVSVGYMDPGNWATDLAGGSKFGFTLLWVILLSNLMAQFLQVLCARMGLVTGKDLAMASRDYYKRPAAIALWILCEIAIIACDLAEVVGAAVALNLLFGISLEAGVLITGLDVILLLGLMKFGFRKIEAIVLTLVMTVFGCFVYEIVLANPPMQPLLHGLFVPSMPGEKAAFNEALMISVGILGATVMPHNLYLHSSIVQTRRVSREDSDIKEAIKFNTLDTIGALSLAFFVNAAILILAASVFHGKGTVVSELQEGHKLLGALLGGGAATVFAVALLASGQSSTITGTLAGQIVMEGFMRWRVKPWVRRLGTRLLAIIPAIAVIHSSGGANTVQLLVISQVVLSMQLPFAIFPLMIVTSDAVRMGKFVNPLWVKILGFVICTFIVGLNVFLLKETAVSTMGQTNGIALLGGVIALVVGFIIWVTFFYKEKVILPKPVE